MKKKGENAFRDSQNKKEGEWGGERLRRKVIIKPALFAKSLLFPLCLTDLCQKPSWISTRIELQIICIQCQSHGPGTDNRLWQDLITFSRTFSLFDWRPPLPPINSDSNNTLKHSSQSWVKSEQWPCWVEADWRCQPCQLCQWTIRKEKWGGGGGKERRRAQDKGTAFMLIDSVSMHSSRLHFKCGNAGEKHNMAKLMKTWND